MNKDADGVATITWDVAGKTMNVMSLDGVQQLNDHIDDALADDAVKGIVITSGKETFAGGMDLNLLAKMKADAGDEYLFLGAGEFAFFPWASTVDLFADSASGTPTLEVRIFQA